VIGWASIASMITANGPIRSLASDRALAQHPEELETFGRDMPSIETLSNCETQIEFFWEEP